MMPIVVPPPFAPHKEGPLPVRLLKSKPSCYNGRVPKPATSLEMSVVHWLAQGCHSGEPAATLPAYASLSDRRQRSQYISITAILFSQRILTIPRDYSVVNIKILYLASYIEKCYTALELRVYQSFLS